MGYSKDLKIKVAKFRLQGNKIITTAETFSVGTGSVSRWTTEFAETGDIKKAALDRTKRQKVTEEKIKAFLEKNPDGNQQEMAKEFGCTNQSVSAALKKFKYSLKKNGKYTKNDVQ